MDNLRNKMSYEKLFVFFSLLAQCALAQFRIHTASQFELPVVSFDQLISLDQQEVHQMFEHLSNLGAIQIRGIPKFGIHRNRALEEAAACMEVNQGDAHKIPATRMADGSKRLSVGAKSELGLSGPISHHCGEASYQLRSTVDMAMRQVFVALDTMREHAGRIQQPLMQPNYRNFQHLMSHGNHLEHLHTYFSAERARDSVPDEATIDFHVDTGLMIAMTTGYYGNTPASVKSGLYIELENGDKVKALASDDSLIVLMGEGTNQWLSSGFSKQLRAIPHALYVDLPVGQHATRSWYGKMFLPPGDAIIPKEHKTFAEYHHEMSVLAPKPDQLHHASSKIMPVACTGGNHRYLTAMDTACTSTEIMCWMRCMSIVGLNCSQPLCYNSVDGTTNNGEVTCPTLPSGDNACSPKCVPPTNSTGYCYGVGTSMVMSGFQSIADLGEGNTECINLWFSDWTLDTKTKFAFACIGVLLLGILIQFVSHVRMTIVKLPQNHFYRASNVLLYGLHVVLGYFAMLVAMSYSAELFSMICVGLTLGYALFFWDTKNGTISADPCCPEDNSLLSPLLSASKKDAQLSMKHVAANHSGSTAISNSSNSSVARYKTDGEGQNCCGNEDA